MYFRIFILNLGLILAISGADTGNDKIKFSHEYHLEEQELECDVCHESVFSSTKVFQSNFPEKDVCNDCHDGDTAPDDCSFCHSNADDPRALPVQIIPQLIFSHKFHLGQGIDCESCHADVWETNLTKKSKPIEMPLCMTCHEEPRTNKDCFTCHESLLGKTPDSHLFAWKENHGLEVTNNCFQCHRQDSCDDCHLKQQFEKKSHPPEFDYTHGQDFLSFSSDCATCHEMPDFCSSCHIQMSILPLSHGFGWVLSTFPGGLHGEEALDNPDLCQLCHIEPQSNFTCQRCHTNDNHEH
ncbi:MAG: cytochrome c3 family protein [Candidatus Neomarinimicrobiota bacterium]